MPTKKPATSASAASAPRRRGRPAKAYNTASAAFLPPEQYAACIDGLRGQGIDHSEAVETLKIGLRQANGRPVPMELLAHSSVTQGPQAVHA